MKHFLRVQAYFLLPLACVLLLVLAFAGFSEQSAAVFFRSFHPEHPTLTWLLRGVTNWGNLCILAVYLLFLGKSIYTRNAYNLRFLVSFIVIQYGLVLLLVHGLKVSVGSPRPYTQETLRQPFAFNSDYHSFPSGHTYEATGLCGPMAQRGKSCLRALAWGLVPAVIGFSRIYLGKHYIMDVAGGALLGSLATFFVFKLSTWGAFWHRWPFFTFR